MLESRTVGDLTSICPAAFVLGETSSGSGILCRVTGRTVTTGANPASLRAFCCNPIPSQTDITADGDLVAHGFHNCPSWKHNRDIELGIDPDLPENTPQRVRQALSPGFITRA